MELSLLYFVFIPFILLCAADPTEFDLQCPLPRRLLSISGLHSSSGEKKSHHTTPSSKSSASSPPKYARTIDAHGLTVYIRPQTSKALGQKSRSYTHLLKSKSHTDEEKSKLKRPEIEKKKQLKNKDSTQYKSSSTTKTKELVAVKDSDLHRCETLLHIDSKGKNDKKTKPSKAPKPNLNPKVKSPKIKHVTKEVTKTILQKQVAAIVPLTVDDKKEKVLKINSKTNPDDKKKIKKPLVEKPSENKPLTPSVNDIPIKTISTSTSSPPKPSKNAKSKEDTKSKDIKSKDDAKTKDIKSKEDTKAKEDKKAKDIKSKENTESETLNQINDTIETSNMHDPEHESVVGRAYHFVKNVFQLSDDFLSDNFTHENSIIDLTNEHQQYQSRKLLSINDDRSDDEFDLYSHDETLNPTNDDDDLSFVAASISKRHLLSVKTNKQSMSSKTSNEKENKSKAPIHVNKPKVGWTYRYRISRYLEAQNSNKNKITGEGKVKHSQQKQLNAKENQKKAKRKLLEYDSDDDSSWDDGDISNQNTANTVSITETFVPKRQLLKSKRKDKNEENIQMDDDHDNGDDVDDNPDKTHKFRRMKSLEESTDPILIVQSYDRGLFKPRVGWQFRYRVSRYIDSLRENIREDQERLKLGLQAIKRKTPQELSGRRKRVLDKPFDTNPTESKKSEEIVAAAQDNKPNVGWRYRYRINKMIEAQKRGDYVDDEKEKRKEQIKQAAKRTSSTKHEDNENILEEKNFDPELRQVNSEGRRVGWAYRYRIRRKLDHLKQQQAERGIVFDLPTLSTKYDKKVVQPKLKSTEKKIAEPIEEKPKNTTKSVGWQYRYRVSKMNEALKQNKSKISKHKQQDQTSTHENLDSDLTKLKPEERVVGWKYRYRIRRKLDSLRDADRQENEKHTRKPSSKRKNKENVKESIEKILNIDDIDETPFMEYFRRASSHAIFGVLPTLKKSICILPLPMKFSFCEKENNEQSVIETKKPKKIRIKKLKTKKEHRAKQFIHSHRTRLGADDKFTERRVDETMRELYRKPSLPPPQTPSLPQNTEKPTKRKPQLKRPNYSEQRKHFHEEHSIKKRIGIETKPKKSTKQFQILGKEIKPKRKQRTLQICPFAIPSPVKNPKKTTPTPPPSPPPSPPRLRTLSEFIQEEATTLFGGTHSSSKKFEDINDEITEVNEIIQESSKLKATKSSTILNTETSNKEPHSIPSDNDNTATEQHMKENVHNILELENDQHSS